MDIIKGLYRGKHIHLLSENKHLDGTWIYGYLCDENYINSPELEGEFLVDAKTICPYTGVNDKNNKEIFWCDIVSVPFMRYNGKSSKKQGIVEFEDGAFSVNWIGSEEYGKSLLGYVNDIEVIGNVFDNPDLLYIREDVK